MVKHICKKCDQVFYKKSALNDHLKRKIPCNRKVDPNLKCKYCSKNYSRKDSLNRHIKNIHTNNFKDINVENNNVKNGNIIVGNNNVINQYFLLPFGQYNFNDLTTTEKVAIFSSEFNPIEMIIVGTHLEPKRTQYHNCGIDDLHSGYGIIYDGNKWEHWRISQIMTTLIEMGQKNSEELYNKIKHFFLDAEKKNIEYNLDKNKYLLQPRHDHYNIDINCKKNLIAHLRLKFYDKYELVEDAIIKSGKPVIKINKNKTKNILKEGITIEDVDNFFKEEEKIKLRVDNLRQMCNQLLFSIGDKINELDKKMIADYIDTVSDINIFNTIFNLLTTKYFFGKTITYKLLMNKINLNNEMNNYIK